MLQIPQNWNIGTCLWCLASNVGPDLDRMIRNLQKGPNGGVKIEQYIYILKLELYFVPIMLL